MNRITDIEGKELAIGDTVYYARKQNYSAKGELVKVQITDIYDNGCVRLGKFTSTKPNKQLLKV